jgi:Methyltransferase domain
VQQENSLFFQRPKALPRGAREQAAHGCSGTTPLKSISQGSADEVTVRIQKFFREVATTPYYRRRPVAALRFAYAKWVFSRSRVHDPMTFLTALDIDISTVMTGFQTWLPTFEKVVSAVRAHQGQHGGISLEDGTILYGITRALKPNTVIETGVAAGVSTAFISAALIDNGHGRLYSIELPPQESAARVHPDGGVFDWPDAGVGWAIPPQIRQALGQRHTLLLRDVRLALPALLSRLPDVDIFFHDDLHTPDHMLWEFELVWPHLRPGGVLISDDVNFGWIRFCRKHRLGERALDNMQRLSAVRKHAAHPGGNDGPKDRRL